MFAVQVAFSNQTPVQDLRRLRDEGGSLADVAERTATTVSRFRRIVGKVDKRAAPAAVGHGRGHRRATAAGGGQGRTLEAADGPKRSHLLAGLAADEREG